MLTKLRPDVVATELRWAGELVDGVCSRIGRSSVAYACLNA